MDIFEKLNHKFGGWYESLFGENGNSELRPKDVLRKILHAMDDNRSEGIDGKVYVPNRYILVLNLADNDERDYLLSFLDEEELATVLHRYMAQNGYLTRGPLDFTITDSGDEVGGAAAKLTVKTRFEKGPAESAAPVQPPASETQNSAEIYEDLPTVASVYEDDLATVAEMPRAWASLAVTEPDGRHSLITINSETYVIGRSRSSGNDLILSSDGKVSKRHARIERSLDGSTVLTDLGSTNGVLLNGKRIAGEVSIHDLDQIAIGDSSLIFHESPTPDSPKPASDSPRWRAVLSPVSGSRDHILASDNLIGRGITNDIVLEDSSGATRHARIVSHDAGVYTIEDLAGKKSTLVNDRVVQIGERIRLSNGDRVQFGNEGFQYLEKSS